MKKSQERVGFARGLRGRQTDAERAPWAKLRNSQLQGVKFRRQEPMGSYIVDFVSFEGKLIVEINGGQQNEDETKERDAERTMRLREGGYRVIRLWNNEVLINL